MQETAKVVNTSRRVVLDGRGKVTLSGGGKRRILYQDTCDKRQIWTTSHCDDQATPRLVVQNLTFANGNSTGETYEGGGGGAIFVRGGRLKIVRSRFTGNRCDPTGPDLGGGAVRALLAVPRPAGLRDPQHVHPRASAATARALSSIGVSWVDLQQRLHAQPRDRPRRQPAARRARPAAASGGAIYTDGNDFRVLIAGTRIDAQPRATRAAARSSSSATTAPARSTSGPRRCKNNPSDGFENSAPASSSSEEKIERCASTGAWAATSAYVVATARRPPARPRPR